MPESLLVCLIDDDPALRQSLSFLLNMAGFRTACFSGGAPFLHAPEFASCQCAIADIRMPGMSGIDLLRQARSMRPALPMIMITGHADVPLAVEAMKAGAADFIEKPFDDERLIGSIHSALEGPVARDEHQKPRDVMERLEALSDREHEVLLSLVRGNPNKVVAYELGISARTVEIHRAHVMAKMNARNLADLVRMALAAGCLDQAGT